MQTKPRVLVTGLGLATSLGLEVEENWQKALDGISGIRRFDGVGAKSSVIQAVGSVSEADWQRLAAKFPEETSIEAERRTLFGLWAAATALSDAMLSGSEERSKAGVIFAAGLGVFMLKDIHPWVRGHDEFDFAKFGREHAQVCGESMIRNPSDRAASLIGRKFALCGPNVTITSACASATQAVGLAFRAIQRGDAHVMLAGGSDSMINPLGLSGFALLQAATTNFNEPQAACRPFDRKRSGLVVGEGAGAVILEEEAHALRRGARVYGEVCGYASSMDAYQVTAPHPQGLGAVLSMGRALQDARFNCSDIDYINAHGTGTKLNDVTETLAIKETFKERAYKIPISSSKSLIGHLMAAAGAPEFVFTVLTVQRDEIHPTINLTNPDPKCDLDYVPNRRRSHEVRAALSNSFGFGGQNASIIVRKYPTGTKRS